MSFSSETLPEHRLHIRFDDGTEGIVDVTQLVAFTGVFEPLREPEFFTKVADVRHQTSNVI